MDKSQQGKRNRRYGHDAEREWARELNDCGCWAERVTSESKHGNLGDVVHNLTSDFKVKYQLKSGKSPSIWKAMEEAIQSTALSEYYPAALLNRTNGPGKPRDRYVVARAEDWLSLVRIVTDLLLKIERLENGVVGDGDG